MFVPGRVDGFLIRKREPGVFLFFARSFQSLCCWVPACEDLVSEMKRLSAQRYEEVEAGLPRRGKSEV